MSTSDSLEEYVYLQDDMLYVSQDIAISYGTQTRFWKKGYRSTCRIQTSQGYYYILDSFGPSDSIYPSTISTNQCWLVYYPYSGSNWRSPFRILGNDGTNTTENGYFIQGDVPFISFLGAYSVYVKGTEPTDAGQKLGDVDFSSSYTRFFMGTNTVQVDPSFPVFSKETYPVYIVATNTSTGANAVARITYAQATASRPIATWQLYCICLSGIQY